MIAAVTGAWTPLPSDTEAAVKINALAAAYGTEAPFLRLYTGDGAAFAVMDGDAVLTGDSDEARLFLTMDPSVRRIRSDEHNAVKLAAMWGVSPLCDEVMTPSRPFAASPAAVDLTPKQLWSVVEPVFTDTLPPFDVWYADVSHRWRHSLCRIQGAMQDGQAVSAAMTTAEDDRAAVIGAVATLPEYRGRGYAGEVVCSLAAALQAAGKTVYLSPKNEHARNLYRRLGFIPCGRYGQVVR